MRVMSTRAIEVAPGVFVLNPEDILAVHGEQPMVRSKKDKIAWCRMVYRGGEECGLFVHAPAAEVAAKLWPVEEHASAMLMALSQQTGRALSLALSAYETGDRNHCKAVVEQLKAMLKLLPEHDS